MNRRLGAVCLVLAFFAAGWATGTSGAQSAPEPNYEATDDSGDVELVGGGQGAEAPGAATGGVDLVALRILEENAQIILIEIQMQDLSSPESNLDDWDSPIVYTRFRVDGAAAYYHVYTMGITNGPFTALNGEEARFVESILCISNNAEEPMPFYWWEVYQSCYASNLPAFTFPGQDVFQVIIPKMALLGIGGEGERPGGIPRTIDAGQDLVDWRVVSDRRAGSLFLGFSTSAASFRDTLPDEGVAAPYALAHPAANAKISLTAHGAASGFLLEDEIFSWERFLGVGHVGIAPDRPTVVPIDVFNGADAKRLVNLTVHFPDGGADRFDVRLAPVIEVPAGEARKATLILNATQALTHREDVMLEVHGVSLGRDDEFGSVLIRLVGNTPPSEDEKTLYFHAYDDIEGRTRVGPIDSCIGGCFWDGARWMNTLADDPMDAASEEGFRTSYAYGVFNRLFGGPQSITHERFYLDAPLTADLHYDPAEPVSATVTFSAGVETEATLRVRLAGSVIHDDCPQDERCMEDVFLGEGATPMTIGTSPTSATVTFVIPPDLGILASTGGHLEADVILESEDPRAAAAGFAEQLDIRLHPGQSTITLPLVPDPDPERVSDLFVTLTPAGEAEEFVNPGKTRAFHVLAVNEGVEDAAILLEASPDAETWKVGLQPAQKYKLGPGQSVNVTVLVTAPPDAKEGDVAQIELVATAVAGDGSSSPLMLKAITTTGIEIEDESGPVEADEDTRQRILEEEGGDSPALSIVGAVAATAIALCLIARRRVG